MLRTNFVNYVLIAVAVLLAGAVIDLATGIHAGRILPVPPMNEFLLVLSYYSGFHIVAASIVRVLSLILSLFCSVRARAILYLSLSVVSFLASIYSENPMEVGGVSLLVICSSSLVFIALEFAWRVNRNEGGLPYDRHTLRSAELQ